MRESAGVVEAWCQARNLACPSARTIGRLITDAPDKMRIIPAWLTPKGKRKPVKPRRRKRLGKTCARQSWLAATSCMPATE